MGLHAAGQFFKITPEAEADAPPVEKAVQAWLLRTGIATPPENEIKRYGIDLTEIQMRVVNGLIGRLSEVGYKSDLQPVTRDDIAERFPAVKGPDDLPDLYRNIREIPTLRVGLRELVRLAGMNDDNSGEVAKAEKALLFLGGQQFCYLYLRLVRDKNGQPVKDKDDPRLYKKELISGVDTLFKVRTSRDEKTGVLNYYEVEPSALFMDQKEEYYMLIPRNWQDEVRRVVGTKKASSDTFMFLLWLRYRFEMIRRKRSQVYELKMSWVEVAKGIRMHEAFYTRQKARAIKRIETAYGVAKELGYLSEYQRGEKVDVLTLNPAKFPRPKRELAEP